MVALEALGDTTSILFLAIQQLSHLLLAQHSLHSAVQVESAGLLERVVQQALRQMGASVVEPVVLADRVTTLERQAREVSPITSMER
jgi:hypothetical protein